MFGLGKGSIEIQIDRYNFRPGETIEGFVVLKLSKPIKARGVFIRLFGERDYSQGIGASRERRSEKVYDFKQPISAEKEYTVSVEPQLIPFKIKTPPDGLGQQMQGVLGTLARAAQLFTGSGSTTKWFLVANIDIPKAIDVSKTVQINIV